MNEKTDFVLVKRPSSALEKAAPGAKRVLSGMVADALALAKKEPSALTAVKFRIGDYEWCEPDYRQILVWAKALSINPEEIIDRLLNGNRYRGELWQETQFSENQLMKINWDNSLLPIKNLQWVDGLRTTHLSFCTRFLDHIPFIEDGDIQILQPALPELTHLSCPRLKMACLNLSKTPNLTVLHCYDNQLTELALSKTPKLEILFCSSNKIPDLNFSQNKNLKSLSCDSNKLTHLDLGGYSNLIKLDCSSNKIEMLELENTPRLEELNCECNKLTHLDLSGASNLSLLNCDHNKMSRLELNGVEKLKFFSCEFNALSHLDLTSVPNLLRLTCAANKLAELFLNKTPNLEQLDCKYNDIEVLDIRPLFHLKELDFDRDNTRLIQRPDQNF